MGGNSRGRTSRLVMQSVTQLTQLIGQGGVKDVLFGVLHTALISAMADARLAVGWARDPVIHDRITIDAA